jgi:hypothetical protein
VSFLVFSPAAVLPGSTAFLFDKILIFATMKNTTLCTAINLSGNNGLKPGKMYDIQVTIGATIDVQVTQPLIDLKYSSLEAFLRDWECLSLAVPDHIV